MQQKFPSSICNSIKNILFSCASNLLMQFQTKVYVCKNGKASRFREFRPPNIIFVFLHFNAVYIFSIWLLLHNFSIVIVGRITRKVSLKIYKTTPFNLFWRFNDSSLKQLFAYLTVIKQWNFITMCQEIHYKIACMYTYNP